VVDTADGLRLAARAAPAGLDGAAVMACVRPEAIQLGGHAAENRLDGTVADIVYTAGTLRYRIRLGGACHITVRHPSSHAAPDLAVGQPVAVSWRAHDTLLIPKE
jgi:putative spermidine/putrescine transport system ATP-binding protein